MVISYGYQRRCVSRNESRRWRDGGDNLLADLKAALEAVRDRIESDLGNIR